MAAVTCKTAAAPAEKGAAHPPPMQNDWRGSPAPLLQKTRQLKTEISIKNESRGSTNFSLLLQITGQTKFLQSFILQFFTNTPRPLASSNSKGHFASLRQRCGEALRCSRSSQQSRSRSSQQSRVGGTQQTTAQHLQILRKELQALGSCVTTAIVYA